MGPINLLRIVSPAHEFKVADGRSLKNVQDLVVALDTMHDAVFAHHVNEERNDFASWIHFVYHDDKLAQKVEFIQDKKKMVIILTKALQVKEKAEPLKSKRVKKEVRKTSLRKPASTVKKKVSKKKPALLKSEKKVIPTGLPSLSQLLKEEGRLESQRAVEKRPSPKEISTQGPALVMRTHMPELVETKEQPQVVKQDGDLFSMDPILQRVNKMTEVVESIEKEHDSIVQDYLKGLDKIPKGIKEELKKEKTKKRMSKSVPKTSEKKDIDELNKPIRKVKAPEVKIIHPQKKKKEIEQDKFPENLPDLEEDPIQVKPEEKQEKTVEAPALKETTASRRFFFKRKQKEPTLERQHTSEIKERIEPPKELARPVFKFKIKKPVIKESTLNKEVELKNQVVKALAEQPERLIEEGEEQNVPPIQGKKEKAGGKQKGFFAGMFRKKAKTQKNIISSSEKQKKQSFKKDKLIKSESKDAITASLPLPGSMSETENASGWDCKRMHNNILRIEDVAIHYGKNIILKDISFIVNKGDMVAIVGGSGVGKTSLLNALIGHTPLMHGSISYYFAKEKRLIPVTGKSLPFKHKFGFAAQFPSIYPELTVKENLKYFAGLYDLPSSVKKENIQNALKLVRLVGDEHKQAKKLSGGMKKRLDIACSIVHNPEVLILDEPTADMDPLLRNQVWNVLEDINNTGTTIIVASHFLTEVESMCNNVLFLREKSMEYYGDPAGFREKYATTREVEVLLDEGEYDEAVKKLTGLSFIEIKEQYRKKGKLILHSRKSEKMINRALLKALGKSSNIKIHDPSMDMLFKVFAEK